MQMRTRFGKRSCPCALSLFHSGDSLNGLTIAARYYLSLLAAAFGHFLFSGGCVGFMAINSLADLRLEGQIGWLVAISASCFHDVGTPGWNCHWPVSQQHTGPPATP